jgi:hypothetical protein
VSDPAAVEEPLEKKLALESPPLAGEDTAQNAVADVEGEESAAAVPVAVSVAETPKEENLGVEPMEIEGEAAMPGSAVEEHPLAAGNEEAVKEEGGAEEAGRNQLTT